MVCAVCEQGPPIRNGTLVCQSCAYFFKRSVMNVIIYKCICKVKCKFTCCKLASFIYSSCYIYSNRKKKLQNKKNLVDISSFEVFYTFQTPFLRFQKIPPKIVLKTKIFLLQQTINSHVKLAVLKNAIT